MVGAAAEECQLEERKNMLEEALGTRNGEEGFSVFVNLVAISRGSQHLFICPAARLPRERECMDQLILFFASKGLLFLDDMVVFCALFYSIRLRWLCLPHSCDHDLVFCRRVCM